CYSRMSVLSPASADKQAKYSADWQFHVTLQKYGQADARCLSLLPLLPLDKIDHRLSIKLGLFKPWEMSAIFKKLNAPVSHFASIGCFLFLVKNQVVFPSKHQRGVV